MEELSLPLLISLTLISIYLLTLFFPTRTKFPPGPTPFPLIGNLLHLTTYPHIALFRLSQIYGPILHLKLGTTHTIILSSCSLAKHLFLSHDLQFSSRDAPDAARALDHHLFSSAWLPVAPKWRSLRKISAVHLFSGKRLDSTRLTRQIKIDELLDHVNRCCENGEEVGVGEVAFTTTLNLLSDALFSINLGSYDSDASHELKDVVRRIFEYLGRPNFADFFPVLRYFDPLRVRRDTADCFAKLFEVFDGMIAERLSADGGVGMDDVLQTLLDVSKDEDSDLTHNDIKHLLLDIIAAGSDTSSSTIEWAMAELLRNPSKMEKVQAEVDEILGKNTKVQESDIEKLPYLQAVVKETMRLHPSIPLLLPRKAVEDTQIWEYTVPKDTQLMVNVWAIGRDPESWSNPLEFLPERFLDRDIDMRGVNFELIPFGAGRRICLGMSLAYRMIHHMLAALVHGFSWKLADGMRPEDVDMEERCGLSLQKAKPLIALPLPKCI